MTYSYQGPDNIPVPQDEVDSNYQQAQALADALKRDEEERLRQQQQQEQSAAATTTTKPEAQPSADKPKGLGGVAKELGTAVVGAGIDAVESVGATAEATFTGNLNNPDFKPSWLQVSDDVEPMNQTVWGNVVRSVGEIGVLSLLTRGAARGVAATKIPGLAKAGQFVASSGTTKRGAMVREAVRGGIADSVTTMSLEDNASGELKKIFPWIPDLIATDESDSPMERRIKNIIEGIGLGLVFDKVAGILAARKAARQVADSVDPTVKAADPLEVSAAKEASSAADRDAVQLELGLSKYADDPDGLNGPDPDINTPLYDRHETAVLGVPKDGLRQNLLDAYRMEMDPRQADGRRMSVVTEAAYEKRLAAEDPVRRRVIERLANQLSDDNTFKGEIDGVRVTKDEYKRLAIAKYLDIVDEFGDLGDVDALREQLLAKPKTVYVQGNEVKVMNSESLMAAELLIHTTAGELADISTAARSIDGVLDNTRQQDMALRRMDFLLRETKKHKFIWSQEGKAMQGGGQRLLTATEYKTKMAEIDNNVSTTISTLKQLRDQGDDTLLKGFLDAMSITDGSVKTLDAMDRYMKDKIWAWGSEDGKARGGVIAGLQSTMINSVLSGPKTPIRALAGTSVAVALRPMAQYLGATLKGNDRLKAQALAQMAIWREGLQESLGVASKAWKAHIAGEEVPYQTFAGSYQPLHKSQEWKTLGEWAESRGSDADKFGYRWATWLSMFNSSPFVNYSMGMMSASDAFNRTILGRMELKAKAFDTAWSASDGRVNAELIAKYEDEFRNSVFNKDGLVTSEAARLAGDEAAMTKPLTDWAAKFDQLVESAPLLKPFFMFPKTGINAITLTSKHTPILNRFIKEVHEIRNATPDTLDIVKAKYGIDDIEKAQAIIEGRVALGYMIVGTAAMLYVNGGLTGNGPWDKETRNAWTQTGWKPRSINLGGVWVSYDSLDPFSSILSMVSDIGDSSDEMGKLMTEDWYERLSYVIAMNFTNKSFLAGVAPFAEILSAGGVGQQAARAVSMLANNTVPYSSLRKEIADLMNPGMRELDTELWQYIKNRNPVAKDTLPYKRSPIDGKPLRMWDPLTRFYNAVSPFQVNSDWSETMDELRRSGFDLAFTFKTDSEGNRLSPDQRSRMQNLMGDAGIEGQLKSLFQTKAYQESFTLAQEVRRQGIPSELWPARAHYHTNAIKSIFMEAKKLAELRMDTEDGVTPEIRRARSAKLAQEASKRADFSEARKRLTQLEQIVNLPSGK